MYKFDVTPAKATAMDGGIAGKARAVFSAGVQASKMDFRLRPPGTEVILGMQEQFPVRGNDVAFAKNKFMSFWRTLRTLVGDDAYEKYCEHHACHHANEPVLDRHAFYVKSQQKKWTGINRCC